MSFSLEGRVAVVTGGTSGIGLALVRGLAHAGADIVPLSRRAEQVDAAAREVESIGRKALRVAGDVTDRASLDRALEKTMDGFGRVDILVNCAGITKRTPTLDVSDAEWASILETNLTGTLRACQVFGRQMLAAGYGRIVNIGSLASFIGLLEVAAYTASKSGVAGLTLEATLRSKVGQGPRHPACILLHPDGAAEAVNHPFAAALAKKGWLVVAPTLRATGKSSSASGAARSFCCARRCAASAGSRSSPVRASSWRRKRRASSTARSSRSTAAFSPAA